jgi:hypothetical protein
MQSGDLRVQIVAVDGGYRVRLRASAAGVYDSSLYSTRAAAFVARDSFLALLRELRIEHCRTTHTPALAVVGST